MATAAVEQPVNQMNRKFENMKLDVPKKSNEKPEATGTDQQTYSSFPNDPFPSNASVASTEVISDVVSSFSSREEYPELTYIATPNGFISPNGSIYAGSPGPMMNTPGYIQYPVEGMHYYNPVVDYNYAAQTIYGSVPAGMHYPVQGADGYMYSPQVYQYPVQPFYQQPPVGQYVAAPTGGVVVLDPQDQAILVQNGYNGYGGSMPAAPPITYSQPHIPCDNGMVPVAMSYPPHAVVYPPHTLRASAPAWMEPSSDHKPGKDCKSLEVAEGAHIFPPNKTGNHIPANGNGLKNNASLSSGKVSGGPANFSPSVMPLHRGVEGKNNSNLTIDNTQKKDTSTINMAPTQLQLQESALHQRSSHYAAVGKPSKPIPMVSIKDVSLVLPNGEIYNSEDFVTKYEDAKFFIIKSYSEENVYRSIQYGVWASTPNGNKKLDDAYRDAQRRVDKPQGCPVFLFFSVNGSRQFCGVAEMIGPVDYKKSMDFWEQHKWSGSFPVRWHFIKDVPNSQFRRVILQNNENKPVTNSRDTQEVYLQQGLEMLNIIKSYPARTSILDEFPLCHLPVKTIPDTKPQQQWFPQGFSKSGEQAVQGCTEDPEVKSPKSTSTALKVCDNGSKSKEAPGMVKQIAAKVAPAGVPMDPTFEKERRRVDKENIKVVSKEGILAPA